MFRRPSAIALTLAAALAGLAPATARPAESPSAEAPQRLQSARPPLSAGLYFDPSHRTLCQLVESAARENSLPVGFFARLIRTESRFDPAAVSPVGAQGIAQFMRGTADLRGLADPFEPISAIRASADYLDDLRDRYGNLGLAAAAYNAGENRVSNWMAGVGGLPFETRNYVYQITGRSAEDWRTAALEPGTAAETEAQDETAKEDESCMKIAAGAGAARPGRPAGTAPPTAPWGVQIAGNYSLSAAMGSYHRLQQRHPKVLGGVEPMVVTRRVGGRGPRAFYRVQVPAQSRQEAQRVCQALRSGGGDCLVLRNR